MKTELQGEGTYRYECRKQDCLYCAAMGLQPLPVKYEFEEWYEPDGRPPIYERRMIRHWEDREVAILRKNYRMHPIDIAPLLPARNVNSIAIKMSILRAKKLIPTWK